MTLRDELVRAAVYHACAVAEAGGGHDERVAAARRIVDVHRLAPLLEAEHALERARAVAGDTAARRELLTRLLAAVDILEQAEAEHQARMRDEAIELLRETSALLSPPRVAA